LEEHRQAKLYDKFLLFYYQLGSLEVQEAMAEPIGWRPEPDPNLSLEEQVRLMEEQLRAKLAPSAPPAP
jgi:hypothetical protein